MKKLLIVLLALCFVVWLGCGDDDSTGPEEEEPTVVTAQVFSTETPSLDSANGSAWGSVPSVTVSTGSSSFTAKRVVSSPMALAAASSVDVQAAVEGDTLFMRFIWTDNSHDVWRARYAVTDTSGIYVVFQRGDTNFYKEDKLLVLFKQTEENWDTWHWRALTTDGGRLAEGNRLMDSVLVTDTVGWSEWEIAVAHYNANGALPQAMHEDSCEFTGHILYLHHSVDLIAYPEYFSTRGWQIDQRLPGWRIDSLVAEEEKRTYRGSRWDIPAASDYSSEQYTVVLRRALNTTYSDDLAMSRGSSVTMRIGVTDNLDFKFNQGDSKQAFSSEFTLSIP